MPSKRNELTCFDHVDLGPSEQGFRKLLVVTDKLTGFSQFTKTNSEAAATTADGLVAWIADKGVPKAFLSDEGVAFKNGVIADLRERLKVDHHFVTAYSHWANGKQERLNLTIGNIFRTVLSESKLPETHWCFIVDIVQMIINHTPVKSLNWKAPIEAMYGLEASSPLDAFRLIEEYLD